MHLIGLKDVGFSYTFGEGKLFEKVNLDISLGDRIGLIGPNGCGKTTFLKIILGEEKPVSGKRVQSKSNLQIGYLCQECTVEYKGSLLDYTLGIFPQIQKLYSEFKNLERDSSDAGRATEHALLQERFASVGGWGIKAEAEKTLSGLNFTKNETVLDFKLLSSGQKTKANLARILLSKPDFMVLDEPTNHLDLSSLEWLEKWLVNFKGTLLIVSHDRAFLDKTVNKIWDLRRDSVFKKIKDLSEGEKGEVLIAKLIFSGANFLILDEPTNHLDIDAREALENALENFPGSILFVSHDRYLIKKLANRILNLG